MKKYFVLVLISTILFSCNKPMSCKTSMSDFHQLFDDLVANGNKDEFYLDYEIHSYQFKVNSDKTICKIGYQSFDALENVKYTIEITDLTELDWMFENRPLYNNPFHWYQKYIFFLKKYPKFFFN